jgi:hypothetical protein
MFIFAANNGNHEMYSSAVLFSMRVYIAAVLYSTRPLLQYKIGAYTHSLTNLVCPVTFIQVPGQP